MAIRQGSDGGEIVLTVDPIHVDFLRAHFGGIRAGLLDDLAHHAEALSDPAADRAVAARLAQWLDELERLRLTGVAAELRHVLSAHLQVLDHYNEHARVVAEHDALAHLLAQLDGR